MSDGLGSGATIHRRGAIEAGWPWTFTENFAGPGGALQQPWDGDGSQSYTHGLPGAGVWDLAAGDSNTTIPMPTAAFWARMTVAACPVGGGADLRAMYLMDYDAATGRQIFAGLFQIGGGFATQFRAGYVDAGVPHIIGASNIEAPLPIDIGIGYNPQTQLAHAYTDGAGGVTFTFPVPWDPVTAFTDPRLLVSFGSGSHAAHPGITCTVTHVHAFVWNGTTAAIP
jgi:hypothetical protein